MSDHDAVESTLRRLDRPVRPARSAERRQRILAEFDVVWASGPDLLGPEATEEEVELLDAPAPAVHRRRRRAPLLLAAAVVVLVAGVAAVALGRSDEGTTSVVADPDGPDASPVVARLERFCSEDLPAVGSALGRYADGELGAGADVGPLVDAVAGPVGGLVDDLDALGFDDPALVDLAATVEDLGSADLALAAGTHVRDLYVQLGALLDSPSLPSVPTCDPALLVIP